MAQNTTRRKSVFQEVGLTNDENPVPPPSARKERPQSVRFRSKDEVHVVERFHNGNAPVEEKGNKTHTTIAEALKVGQSPSSVSARTMMYRAVVCLLLIAAAVPLLPRSLLGGHRAALPIQGVDGGPIPGTAEKVFDLGKRADTSTNWCFKWAQQCMSCDNAGEDYH